MARKVDPAWLASLEPWWNRSVVDVAKANLARNQLWDTTHRFVEGYHLLLTPTVAVTPFGARLHGPPKVAGQKVEGGEPCWIPFTFPFNLTGQPAATVPCGFTDSGLPVGLHIVGRRFNDETVLRASAAFEETTPWKDPRPPLN